MYVCNLILTTSSKLKGKRSGEDLHTAGCCAFLIQYLLITVVWWAAVITLGTGERVINKIQAYLYGSHGLVRLVINVALETGSVI